MINTTGTYGLNSSLNTSGGSGAFTQLLRVAPDGGQLTQNKTAAQQLEDFKKDMQKKYYEESEKLLKFKKENMSSYQAEYDALVRAGEKGFNFETSNLFKNSKDFGRFQEYKAAVDAEKQAAKENLPQKINQAAQASGLTYAQKMYDYIKYEEDLKLKYYPPLVDLEKNKDKYTPEAYHAQRMALSKSCSVSDLSITPTERGNLDKKSAAQLQAQRTFEKELQEILAVADYTPADQKRLSEKLSVQVGVFGRDAFYQGTEVKIPNLILPN